ncbi:MAG: DUF4317 domain-containing protein [Lachnospiraceae bacterium]|nr:DUF4317 domain-containing protein [Lachnospiraceae bacterium]
MNRSDINTIKKIFKKDDGSVRYVDVVAVNLNNEQTQYHYSFWNLEEDVAGRYVKMANQSFSAGNGVLAQDVDLVDEDMLHTLKTLAGNGSDEAFLEALTERINEKFERTTGFLLVLLSGQYDVPARTTDKMALDESEIVYSYVLGMVCPLKPSKTELEYDDARGGVCLADIYQILQKPAASFLYPAFVEGEPDDRMVYCHAKDKAGKALMVNLFGADMPKEEPKKPKTAPAPVLPEAEDGPDNAPSVYTTEDGTEIPYQLSPVELQGIGGMPAGGLPTDEASAALAADDAMAQVMEGMENAAAPSLGINNMNPAPVGTLGDGSEVPPVSGRITDGGETGDSAPAPTTIQTQMINGQVCYIIPADLLPIEVIRQYLKK